MPAYKGTKILGTLSGGFHPKGTAPVAGMTGTRGPRTTDPDMVNRPTMSNDDGDINNTYVSAKKSNRRRGGRKMAKGGSTASKRADGCCTKGKTRGRIV